MSAASAQPMYEPGPSFNDNVGGLDPAQLPSWLQNFRETIVEAPTPLDLTPDRAVKGDAGDLGLALDVMPEWLSEARADAPPAPAAHDGWYFGGATHDGALELNFISEDDLPDWLRSISVEPPAPAAAAPTVVGNASGSRSVTMMAPPVAAAWIVSRQTMALAAGEALFAHLASEDARTATTAVSDGPRDQAQSALVVTAAESPMLASTAATVERQKRRSQRLLLYVALIIVLLAIFFALK